jgi:hypothetical protein
VIDVAVIAATPHLEDVSSTGTIDMALTHLVLTQPAHAAYFRARSSRGTRVILDNSAYERQNTTGTGMDADPVLRAAEQIDADVVVCQDVLFDGPATLTATRRFLDVARRRADLGRRSPRFMGVPQGRTRAEWLECCHRLAEMPEIDVIGLSKLSVPRCFGAPVAEARVACAAYVLGCGAPKPLHLLGGDRSLIWELREHRRLGHDQPANGVCSNDSSFAFWYAAEGIGVDVESGRAHRHAGTMPDLVARTLTGTELRTALGHVAFVRSAAGLPPFRMHHRGAPSHPNPVGEEDRACP